MCTITVYRPHQPDAAASFIVTMNRDERRDRDAETQPAVYADLTIYPLDQTAGGTWCGVNHASICLSLLNRYDGIDYVAARSRGLLIPELLQYTSVQDIKLALVKMDLSQFAPFTLMINTATSCDIAHWTGKNFLFEHPILTEYMHLSSSSWRSKDVLRWRKRAFKDWVSNGAKHTASLPAYNLYQPKDKADYAPLVSRPQTFTKSITQFHCQASQVHSRYWNDAALADHMLAVELTMPLCTA